MLFQLVNPSFLEEHQLCTCVFLPARNKQTNLIKPFMPGNKETDILLDNEDPDEIPLETIKQQETYQEIPLMDGLNGWVFGIYENTMNTFSQNFDII